MTKTTEELSNCEACGKQIGPGQVLFAYEDAEVHADCDHPYSLKTEKSDDDGSEPFVLLGEPLVLVRLSSIADRPA